jgi:putative transposase
MTSVSTKPDFSQPAIKTSCALFDDGWFDPIELSVRSQVRVFIEEMIQNELDAALARPRYGRRQKAFLADGDAKPAVGHRHGGRERSLTGTFGKIKITVPRARLEQADGTTTEWRSGVLRAYQRRTLAADALIAGSYLAGTNTRRVRRALASLFGGAVGKDVVSRTWRKVKSDWDAWNARPLVDEPIVRLILDGTVVRVRLDRQATSIVLLVVLGVRTDGQKVLLAVRSMGSESAQAWRTVLDDLIKRGLRRPEFLIVDGGAGLDKAIAAVWDGVPVQRCTVHKQRNLLAHAPKRLHEEINADYSNMIFAETREEIEARRKAFIRKWRLKHRAVADSLEEATACLRSSTCRRVNGRAHGPPMPSSACMKSSSGESRRRLCFPLQKPLPCCSGRCSLQDRSPCARLTAGTRSTPSPAIGHLTSQLDQVFYQTDGTHREIPSVARPSLLLEAARNASAAAP